MAQDNTIKERNPMYPIFQINEKMDFVKEIGKIGGKKASVETVASMIGMSVKTNSFKSKISTAKQFGLIRGTGGVVELTDLAKKLIYAVDDRETQRLLIEAFLTAPLYRKIAERFENQAIPTADKLSNILLLEYGVTKTAKDVAANKFIESSEQVGVLKSGIIYLDPEDDADTASSPAQNASVVYAEDVSEKPSYSNKQNDTLAQEENGFCFAIPTLSGSTARITIPRDVTSKDLDFITLYIQNMLPAFISNLKEELDK